MAGGLTQKDKTNLQDQMRHEEVCIRKYTDYAGQSKDPALSALFNEIASEEQEHYDTLQDILSGTNQGVGSFGSSQSGSGSQDRQYASTQNNGQSYSGQADQSQSGGSTQSTNIPGGSKGDAPIVRDMLMTEQFVSGSYDSAIFDSMNPQVRQTLQHIQKEEQQHGERLRSYMQQNGMDQQQ